MAKHVLLLIFAISSSQACAPCDCTVPYTMVCRNLKEFPTFNENERRQTTLLDITESSITSLPEFTRRDWPVLDIITLWNNTNDLCQYSGWQGDILFENHDCPQAPPTIEVCLPAESEEHPTLILGEAMLGGMLPTSLLIILIAIIRVIQMHQRRQRNATDPINTTNSSELQQL